VLRYLTALRSLIVVIPWLSVQNFFH